MYFAYYPFVLVGCFRPVLDINSDKTRTLCHHAENIAEGFVHLHSYRLRNFRRLKDAHIELADDISIFVGSNNSGKMSATQAIHSFIMGGKDRFSL